MRSIGLFFIRDAATIYASFTLPKPMSKKLAENTGLSPSVAYAVTQIVLPVGLQFFSTPIHLLGLDCFNNPQSTLAARWAFLKREYLKSALARCGRILPAFGIAGVGNTKLREHLHSAFGDKSASL